jgi:molecular chaperone GrpE (heat shock protein)
MEMNIEKLFESLGVEGIKHSTQTPNAAMYLIQNMITDKNVFMNMQAMNEDIKKAIQKHEEIRLDAWSLKDELKEAEAENEALKKQLKEAEHQLEKLQNLEAQNIGLNTKIDELQTAFEKCTKDLRSSENRAKDITESLVSFRDSIILKEGLCAENKEESSVQLHKLLTVLLKETAGIFEKNDIEILDQKGTYDSSIQIVTDVKPTKDKELQDTVAETFRPGYRYGDVLIRPQEVILYSYTAE